MLNLFQHRKHTLKIEMKIGSVYIMGNKWKTTLYVGVTADLAKRVIQHKSGAGSEFTGKYLLSDLLYYERIGGMVMKMNL